jgi:hypothetical protein
MKRIIIFCVFILFSNCLFGQELLSAYPINLYEVNEFSDFSPALSPLASSKDIRAVDNKWPAFVLNLILGLGIGSFVQGDIFGGVFSLCGELGGLAFLLVGVIPEPNQGYQSYYTTGVSYPNIGFAYAGLGVLLGVRIFELVRPFTYANRFSVAFAPSLDSNGQPALAAMVKFKM